MTQAHARPEAGQRAPGGPLAIEVSHLSKSFGTRTAVADVSFSVARGEVFGFLGPNGAGKTTTVRILGTLIAATAGAAVVAGIPLERANDAEIRRRISIMPEAPGLYRRLTVTENLEFFARLYGTTHPAARIREVLDAVNLGERANDLCGSLSKGLRQRVALARALLPDPEVLFLDEPTSGLDPVAAHEVHGLINTLRLRGVSIFLTTHRLDEAERLCDRVAIMNTSLQTIGRPDELRRTMFSRALVVTTAAPLSSPDDVFAGQPGVQTWRSGEPPANHAASYVLTVSDPVTTAPGVTRALVARGADVLSIGEPKHTLEDVYLQLVDDQEARSR
jgi:ABC-2 type transport system ATP-binding protein